MAQVTLKGKPVSTIGELPKVGEQAVDTSLVKTDLSRVNISDFKGSKVVLNIFPSVDTSTCALSVRQFNKVASELPNTKVLCVSKDLPFAHTRFCGTEGLNEVITLSDYENGEFGKKYGVEITDGPLRGLTSRAVVVIDEEGRVIYTEQVQEISEEPNYDEVLKVIKKD